MSLYGRKRLLAVRALGNDGYYPRFALTTTTHRYEATEGLVWIAVVQPPLPEGSETSESPSLLPEEVKLLAAIALSEGDPWSHGMPVLTLGTGRWEEDVEANFDLTSQGGNASIQAALIELRRQIPEEAKFELRARSAEEDALALLHNFDSQDELLLAGVNSLLTGDRLLGHRIDELEAASLCFFVAMGAALEYIRLHLDEARGITGSSFAEVHQYLGKVYPKGNVLPRYLEEMYEHRVIATHPASRFGEFCTPPLMIGEIYDLPKHLRVIFRHIVLGERPQLQFDE